MAAVVLRPLTRAIRPLSRSRLYHAPVRDMRFQLYTVHEFDKHYATLGNEVTCDKDTIDMVNRQITFNPDSKLALHAFSSQSNLSTMPL